MTFFVVALFGVGFILVASAIEGSSLVQTVKDVWTGNIRHYKYQGPKGATGTLPPVNTQGDTSTSTPLSFTQLRSLAGSAGFDSALSTIMAAIALAESGGDPNAINPTDNGGKQSSYGLWQISTGTHDPPDPNWSTPSVNARLAYQKWTAQGLNAWGTYTSGAYEHYLPVSGTVPL